MATAYAEDVVGSLLSALECPICLEYIQPTIWQCLNGHCICKECLDKKLKECPLCKVNIENPARNLIADKFVSEIMFPCKFSKDGCTERMHLKDIIIHQKVCGYFGCCNIGDCDWRGPISSLMEHVIDNHDGSSSFGEYSTLSFKLPYIPDEHVTIIDAHGKLFRSYFTFDETESNLYGNVVCLGPQNDENTFEYQYEFRSPSGEYHLIFQQVASYVEVPNNFILSESMLDQFYIERKNKLLTCSVRIIKN